MKNEDQIRQTDRTKTNPGFHKMFLLENFPSLERGVLEKMSKEFYMTNSGNTITLGANFTFSYFLIKPTETFREMFNIDREILCVFSPYKNFEPRTLDAFDASIKDINKQLRVENVCRVLITDDNLIEAKISNLLKNDPEQPIIIPFSYTELISPYDSFFIRNKFRQHFYTRDLFSYQSPLKRDLYFFGRSELIQDIANRHKAGENSGLFGLRKSGKTSIVYGIERSLESKDLNCVSIDCENPSVHFKRWYELLYDIAILIRERIESKITINPDNYTEKNAGNQFFHDVVKVFSSKKTEKILLIFDEIERISPRNGSSPHWRDGDDFVYFWQTMRSFFQKERKVFSYLLVGTNPLCVEMAKINGNDNPLFSSLPFQYVPPFDMGKTREMVRKLGRYMGLKFDEIVYAKLTEDFGGHPFLIRHVCSQINKNCKGNRPHTVNKGMYEKSKNQFINNSKNYFSMIVDVLKTDYKDEYDMLLFLASGDIDSFMELKADDHGLVAHLSGYGLITEQDEESFFNIESLKEYLTESNKYIAKILTTDQKLAEISERRNKLEKLFRDFIKKVVLLNYGKNKSKDIILSCLSGERRKKIENFDYEDIFDDKKSPLLFLEIINVLNKNWSLFQNVIPEEKQRALMILEDINKGRFDAHAKEPSEDQFTQLRLHFNKVENWLEEWR